MINIMFKYDGFILNMVIISNMNISILICYLNLQHFKKQKILDQVSTESASRIRLI